MKPSDLAFFSWGHVVCDQHGVHLPSFLCTYQIFSKLVICRNWSSGLTHRLSWSVSSSRPTRSRQTRSTTWRGHWLNLASVQHWTSSWVRITPNYRINFLFLHTLICAHLILLLRHPHRRFFPTADTVAFYVLLTSYDTITDEPEQPVPFDKVLINDGDGWASKVREDVKKCVKSYSLRTRRKRREKWFPAKTPILQVDTYIHKFMDLRRRKELLQLFESEIFLLCRKQFQKHLMSKISTVSGTTLSQPPSLSPLVGLVCTTSPSFSSSPTTRLPSSTSLWTVLTSVSPGEMGLTLRSRPPAVGWLSWQQVRSVCALVEKDHPLGMVQAESTNDWLILPHPVQLDGARFTCHFTVSLKIGWSHPPWLTIVQFAEVGRSGWLHLSPTQKSSCATPCWSQRTCTWKNEKELVFLYCLFIFMLNYLVAMAAGDTVQVRNVGSVDDTPLEVCDECYYNGFTGVKLDWCPWRCATSATTTASLE